MEDVGLRRMGFFELAPLGLPLALVGWSPRCSSSADCCRRDRTSADSPLIERAYLTDAILTPDSRLIGKELSYLTDGLGIPVLRPAALR